MLIKTIEEEESGQLFSKNQEEKGEKENCSMSLEQSWRRTRKQCHSILAWEHRFVMFCFYYFSRYLMTDNAIM